MYRWKITNHEYFNVTLRSKIKQKIRNHLKKWSLLHAHIHSAVRPGLLTKPCILIIISLILKPILPSDTNLHWLLYCGMLPVLSLNTHALTLVSRMVMYVLAWICFLQYRIAFKILPLTSIHFFKFILPHYMKYEDELNKSMPF